MMNPAVLTFRWRTLMKLSMPLNLWVVAKVTRHALTISIGKLAPCAMRDVTWKKSNQIESPSDKTNVRGRNALTISSSMITGKASERALYLTRVAVFRKSEKKSRKGQAVSEPSQWARDLRLEYSPWWTKKGLKQWVNSHSDSRHQGETLSDQIGWIRAEIKGRKKRKSSRSRGMIFHIETRACSNLVSEMMLQSFITKTPNSFHLVVVNQQQPEQILWARDHHVTYSGILLISS